MREKQKAFRGALLGLAVGDAMGCTVDRKTLQEICADYGPNGLLGYDLANGYAEVSSYTQLAAFCANALLLGLTRRQMQNRNIPLIRYIGVALREWSRSQQYSAPERNYCWLSTVPELKRRRCMDTRMLDALSREADGIYVCDACGTAEALKAFMKNPLPVSWWAMFRLEKGASHLKELPGTEAMDIVREQDMPILTEIGFEGTLNLELRLNRMLPDDLKDEGARFMCSIVKKLQQLTLK